MGVAIIGVGAFMRTILPHFHATDHDIVLASEFSDDIGTTVYGMTVLSTHDLLTPEHAKRSLCIAIADSAARKRIHEEMSAAGRHFINIHASTSIVYEDASIEEGLVLCHFSLILGNTRIGKQFQCNNYSYVAHDCVIGDYVTFSSYVVCNSNVVVEDSAYVGAGAIIRNGSPDQPIVIGTDAVIGMGAVVTRTVPPGVTVVGNPARLFKQHGHPSDRQAVRDDS